MGNIYSIKRKVMCSECHGETSYQQSRDMSAGSYKIN